MRKYIILINCLLATTTVTAQYLDKCMPQHLIVAGNDVNFRAEPNTSSNPIGKFIDGELINLVSILPDSNYGDWIWLSQAWVRVKRLSNGEEGFIFGRYVKPQEMAYRNHGDCDRIQNGNWYGISQDGNSVIVKRTSPSLKEEDPGYLSIAGSSGDHKILICSQSELQEGKIKGQFYGPYGENFRIGTNLRMLQIGDRQFNLACTGEVDLGAWMEFTRKKEKVYFIIEEIDGSQRHYHKQDLTDCIRQFGEGGYTLIFAGDLNNDGIPEVIFSEGDTRMGAMYYFMSNEDGKLELKSITVTSSKC